MYDILIKNAVIVDGTGDAGYKGDLAVKNGVIAKISERITEDAETIIDATGQVISPGFIDAHTHDDLVLAEDAYNMPKLTQGVTTIIVGNCGFGAAPISDQYKQDFVDYNRPIVGSIIEKTDFYSFSDYVDYMNSLRKGQNIAALVPHGTIYIATRGFSNERIQQEELKLMLDYEKNALEAGAVGISFGLMYSPGCFCSQEDMKPFALLASEYGGIVCIHMKSESYTFEQSIESAASLSRECNVPVEISHLKHVGKPYVGKMDSTLLRLKELKETGADLSYDMYPYTMGSTTMAILFPTEFLSNEASKLIKSLEDSSVREAIAKRLEEDWGEEDNLSLLSGWENVIISSVHYEKNKNILGMSIQKISEKWDMSPAETMFTLYCEEDGDVTILLNHILEEDMEKTLMFDGVSLISDGLPYAKNPHPRLYGSFPRFIKNFVRERPLLSLEKAVFKMTAQPARRFGLEKRGEIKEGYFADLVIFDPRTISDKATYKEPKQYPTGIHYVIVNGEIVLVDNERTGKYPGTFIKKKREEAKPVSLLVAENKKTEKEN